MRSSLKSLYKSYIHILHGRYLSSAQTKYWSHINCTDKYTLSLHIIYNIVWGCLSVDLCRHSTNNCAALLLTSVNSEVRIVCTEHDYCLQDVRKNVCRVYCLQGVIKKRLQGVVKKIVCRVQKKSWAAGCRSAGCLVGLSARTKRSSAGCILGLVMQCRPWKGLES